MDPDANLQLQEEKYAEMRAAYRPEDRHQLDMELFELQITLDEWLVSGGYEPDWSKAPTARGYYGK